MKLRVKKLAAGMQRAQAVLCILTHGERELEEWQNDPTYGGKEIGISEREPFEDAVIVFAGAAKEGGFGGLGSDWKDVRAVTLLPGMLSHDDGKRWLSYTDKEKEYAL